MPKLTTGQKQMIFVAVTTFVLALAKVFGFDFPVVPVV